MIKKFLNTKFKKDLSFSYIAQSITITFGFIQLFLINKYFGVEVFGQLAIIISTAGIFSALLSARSSEAVTRFFKREELNKNYENAKFVLVIGFIIDFITSILLVLLIYFLSTFIATTFLKNVNLQDEIIVFSFISFITFLRGSMLGYLQSKEMFLDINMVTIVETVMKIVILLIFIFIVNDLFLINIIYSFLLAAILSFLYTTYVFFKSYKKNYDTVIFSVNKVLLKEYWSFNIKTFFSASLKAGNQNVDNLIIAYFLHAEIVGIYQIIKKMLSPIIIIATPFSMLVYPKLINYFETNNKTKFKHIIIKISFYILSIGVIYSFIFYFLLNFSFDLMYLKFDEIYYIYYLFLVGLMIINSQMWWVRAFSSTVNPNYSIYMNLFATVYQLIITILIIKYFGFIGMLVSIIIMNILIMGFWLKKGYEYVRI
jgi:O-antigen/teichoic acid export membrane protein